MKNNEVFNLTFHGLGQPGRELPPGEEHYWVDRVLFAGILDQVVGRKNIQITFDDANESDYTIAFPELLARKLKARFFVVADRINQKGCLSAKQIQEMCAAGMPIENHGWRHVPWRTCNQAELHQELVDARVAIEQVTQKTITEAACPYGSYNRTVFKTLRENNYQTVYTSDSGTAWENSWLQARNTIVRTDTVAGVTQLMSAPPNRLKQGWRNLKMLIKRWR